MTYEPGPRVRALMDEEEAIDPQQVSDLQEQISTNSEAIETFNSKGWPHIVATLQFDIAAAEQSVLSGRFEDNPKDAAYVRGQIAAYRTLLSLPARVEQDVRDLEQRFRELTEQPS